MCELIELVGGIPWLKTSATYYLAQLGLHDKGRTVKELFVFNSWNLEPLVLLQDWP